MKKTLAVGALTLLFALTPHSIYGQGVGNAGAIRGTVLDPSSAAVKGAVVEIQNPVSHYNRTVVSGGQGEFEFDNVPYNAYHLTVNANGFQTGVQDVDVRSPIPVALKVTLQIGTANQSVSVVAGADLVESDPTPHTDVDRALFDKLPLESASSSLSSLVTLVSPENWGRSTNRLTRRSDNSRAVR